MIIGCLGPEGASKSALMAALTHVHRDNGGGQAYAFPGYTVYTRPEEYKDQFHITETIRTEDWIRILNNNEQASEQWDGTLIDIDEIQQWFPAELWQLVGARIFGYVATQRRKRGLSIVYTVMQSNWLNNRLRDLTHLVIYCFDMYWFPPMRAEGIQRGERSILTFVDNKGFFTGWPGAAMGRLHFNTKKLWPCFESYTPVDVWEAMTKVRITGRPEVEVDLHGGLATSPLAPPAQNMAQPIMDVLQHGLGDFEPMEGITS